jgi:AraC family transcriptional activator of pobA
MSFPSLKICQLHSNRLSNDLLSIDKLEDYVPSNPQVSSTHSHGFYHLAYITQGTGKHTIDFKHFEVVPHTIYFMHPLQVHQWDFNPDVKGYVINFSETLLVKGYINAVVLDVLQIFKRQYEPQVFHVNETLIGALECKIVDLSDAIKSGYMEHPVYIAHQLMDILLLLNKNLAFNATIDQQNHKHFDLYNAFLALVETKYLVYKLPHQYASALHVTLPLLNDVVKEFAHRTVGEVIRERILLEAKRLLVNKDTTISEIAYHLNFSDNSYFVKFFKKYIGQTPEQFRKELQ